jgi:hypothetical protein
MTGIRSGGVDHSTATFSAVTSRPGSVAFFCGAVFTMLDHTALNRGTTDCLEVAEENL